MAHHDESPALRRLTGGLLIAVPVAFTAIFVAWEQSSTIPTSWAPPPTRCCAASPQAATGSSPSGTASC